MSTKCLEIKNPFVIERHVKNEERGKLPLFSSSFSLSLHQKCEEFLLLFGEEENVDSVHPLLIILMLKKKSPFYDDIYSHA